MTDGALGVSLRQFEPRFLQIDRERWRGDSRHLDGRLAGKLLRIFRAFFRGSTCHVFLNRNQLRTKEWFQFVED